MTGKSRFGWVAFVLGLVAVFSGCTRVPSVIEKASQEDGRVVRENNKASGPIISLNLSLMQLNREDAQEIDSQRELVALSLNSTGISDEFVRDLLHLTKLRELRLAHTQVTNAGVEFMVSTFGRLETLDLGGTKVTDEVMKKLAGQKQMRSVALNLTQISDQGVMQLSLIENLEGLDLTGTALTDRGMRDISSL